MEGTRGEKNEQATGKGKDRRPEADRRGERRREIEMSEGSERDLHAKGTESNNEAKKGEDRRGEAERDVKAKSGDEIFV